MKNNIRNIAIVAHVDHGKTIPIFCIFGFFISANPTLHHNKPRIIIPIAFFMIPKSYTKINVESVHEFLH